jgi:hypothetical protein
MKTPLAARAARPGLHVVAVEWHWFPSVITSQFAPASAAASDLFGPLLTASASSSAICMRQGSRQQWQRRGSEPSETQTQAVSP